MTIIKLMKKKMMMLIMIMVKGQVWQYKFKETIIQTLPIYSVFCISLKTENKTLLNEEYRFSA
jgi:hypothetical protein